MEEFILLEVSNGSCIEFDYVNWKGIKGHRKVVFGRLLFGSTEYHSEEQWLMEALDVDKDATRVFAISDMSNVKYW